MAGFADLVPSAACEARERERGIDGEVFGRRPWRWILVPAVESRPGWWILVRGGCGVYFCATSVLVSRICPMVLASHPPLYQRTVPSTYSTLPAPPPVILDATRAVLESMAKPMQASRVVRGTRAHQRPKGSCMLSSSDMGPLTSGSCGFFSFGACSARGRGVHDTRK